MNLFPLQIDILIAQSFGHNLVCKKYFPEKTEIPIHYYDPDFIN
jgi:hypothetical protein